MLIFPNAPPIWRQCNQCSDVGKCGDPFPASGTCPHADRIRIQYHHPCRFAESHPHYFSAIAQDAELASIFARWQIGHPIEDKDFAAIRNYHLANNKEEVATHLIYDFLALPLDRLRERCLAYYKRTQKEIDSAFTEAIFYSLTALTPADVAACSARGGHWTLAFMDVMQFMMRIQLKEHYLYLDVKDDNAFRAIFEREWRILKDYLDHRLNFLIIPRLSYQHMARYQGLKNGDANIRQTVSTYLIHQCLFYPHTGAPWMPDLPHKAIWPLIRRAYEPLIGATVARVAGNLQLHNNEVGVGTKNDLRVEVEQAFDKFGAQFNFFLNPPQGFVGRGILGLNEDKEAQVEIDKILEKFGFLQRSTDINATPFSHYIKEKLDWWGKDKYPLDRDFDTSETNVVTGADEKEYLTIQGAAKRFGVSIAQLRYMDKIGALKPIRAAGVAPTFPLLHPHIRLYVNNEQTMSDIEIANARAKTRSSMLSGKQLTRSNAATYLGTTVSTLRSMERNGFLAPGKRGQIVIYDEAVLAQARSILDQPKKRKKRR